MNFVVKLLGSAVTVCFAIIGGLWSAYAVLTGTMDSKVATAKQEIAEVRHAELGALRSEIKAVNDNIGMISQNQSIMYAELLRRK